MFRPVIKRLVYITLVVTTMSMQKNFAKTEFLPFKGYRPRQDLIQEIVCPPYNALSANDARQLVEENPYSFLHISRPEASLKPNTLPYDQQAGVLGKKALEMFIQKGWLVQDEKPCFYLHEQTANGHQIMSIIGEIAIRHYTQGNIKKHELTIPEKEKSLTEFIDLQQAHTDPVVLIYQKQHELQQLIDIHAIKTPATSYIAPDGSKHTLWAIDNPLTISHIKHLFSSIQNMYIADGHHRCAAAQNLLKKDSLKKASAHKNLLAALIPNSAIKLASYNRLIRSLNEIPEDTFFKYLSKVFTIKKMDTAKNAKPDSPHKIAMFLNNSWYQLCVKKELLKKQTVLDLSIINKYILQDLLNITTLNDVENISSINGTIELDELENKCREKKWALAFALHPVSISTFIELVEQGELMPPKTTWFEPKIWQGLVVKKLD